MGSRRYSIFATPLGPLAAVYSDDGLYALRFDGRVEPDEVPASDEPPLGHAAEAVSEWIAAYFDGSPAPFDGPLAPRGTGFQSRVWDALRSVPWGTTCTYSDLARRLGDARSVRAVGAANGANPWPVIVPCHRVIGASGSLTGYGGGLWRKEWLLRHEGVLLL